MRPSERQVPATGPSAAKGRLRAYSVHPLFAAIGRPPSHRFPMQQPCLPPVLCHHGSERVLDLVGGLRMANLGCPNEGYSHCHI
jgi:hypothetical protein